MEIKKGNAVSKGHWAGCLLKNVAIVTEIRYTIFINNSDEGDMPGVDWDQSEVFWANIVK